MITKNLGFLLLAIYLIIVGLEGFSIGFPQMQIVKAILAIAAGVLILVRK